MQKRFYAHTHTNIECWMCAGLLSCEKEGKSGGAARVLIIAFYAHILWHVLYRETESVSKPMFFPGEWHFTCIINQRTLTTFILRAILYQSAGMRNIKWVSERKKYMNFFLKFKVNAWLLNGYSSAVISIAYVKVITICLHMNALTLALFVP